MLRRKILSLSNPSLFQCETIFSRKIISEKKLNYCYGFILGDFQVICGSMVGKNCRSPASTETPGPLLFLLYINDLNQVIKFCKVHHFADDTNLLYLGKSIKKLNKFVNIDLKNLVNWLNASKISLNVKKLKLSYLNLKEKSLMIQQK